MIQTFRGHTKMVLDLALNKDKTLLFSASVDMLARSWLPEVGGEAKVFEGGERSITLLYLKGQTCKCIAYFARNELHELKPKLRLSIKEVEF